MINFSSLIATFVLVGIIFFGLTETHGQSKGKVGLSGGSERDPFSLPSGIYLLSKNKTAPVTDNLYPAQRVKAILISDHIRLALIGPHIVTVGDSINNEKVLEIKPDKVILGKGNKKRSLLLYQGTVPLTVEEK